MASDADLEGLDKHLLKTFDVVRLLGKGAYGIVWKVIEKETGRTMALKKCFDAFQNSTDAQRTFREIMFLQELNGHENIVRLMSVMKAQSHLDLYVVFDHMECDLSGVINADMLQPIHMEYVTYQILKALKYVHSGGVIHRDLKPANVLVNSNCHVRICDFGLARTNSSHGTSMDSDAAAAVVFTDYVATRWYRAPELLLGCLQHGDPVDMWSVGCILGEMVGRKPVLKGRSTMDQLEKTIELTGKPSGEDLKPFLKSSPHARKMLDALGPVRQLPPTNVLFLLRSPPAARALILACLSFNPKKRPTAEKALGDQYVEKFHHQEAEPTCDRIIRMPIMDSQKARAADYRSQIYSLIEMKRRIAKEDTVNGSPRSASPRSPGRSSKVGPSPRRSTSSPRVSRERSGSARSGGGGGEPPWAHVCGSAAPPTTPR